MNRRVHADIIIAWANGAEIQFKDHLSNKWKDIPITTCPFWDRDTEYRVKPEEESYFFPIFSHKEGMEFVGGTGSYYLCDVDTETGVEHITFTGKVAKTNYLDGKIISIEIIEKDIK